MNRINPINVTKNAWKQMTKVIQITENQYGFLYSASSGGCNGFNFELDLLDKERYQNEAQKYALSIVPEARGQAQATIQEAEAYKKQVVAAAEGEASRFLSIYSEYAKAKEVTQERMYLETMEKVLADIDKVIIDRKAGGVVPYLPLPELTKKSKGTNTQ